MEKKKVVKMAVRILLAALMLAALMGMTSLAAGSRTISMKKQKKNIYMSSASVEMYTTFYNKIKLSKPSLVAVTGLGRGSYNQWGLSISICNSKKKKIAGTDSFVDSSRNDVEVYGLKAGTYYIVVKSEKNFTLAAEVTPKADKGGSSKSKAAKIKEKKTVWGLMAAGEKSSKADWYKFHVGKSRVLNITVTAQNNGYFDFYLYGPSYKNGIRLRSMKNEKGSFYSVNLLTNKKTQVIPGTYYIKVSRTSYDKDASGAYALKWNLG